MAKTRPSGLFRKGKRLRVAEATDVDPQPVVEPDPQPEVEVEVVSPSSAAAALSVPDFASMTVAKVIEWAGDDPVRRAAALDAERSADKPRKGILNVLA